MSSILTPGVSRHQLDWLLPFLRLPALRFCLGMTTYDGSVWSSEDLGARSFSVNGTGLVAKSTAKGVPYLSFDGASNLYAANAGWNTITSHIFFVCVYRAAWASGLRFTSNDETGDIGWYVQFGTSTNQLTARVSVDGSTLTTTSLPNGAATSGSEWNLIAMRYNPSTEVKVWGNGLTAANTTSIPASINDAATNLGIGARSRLASTADYLTGDIAVMAVCNAYVDDAHVTALINHAKRFGVYDA